MNEAALRWMPVTRTEALPDGRVMTVAAGHRTLCLSHVDGQWAAMDNRCPHQGGPLGEGSIERGVDGRCWIRCPWHGWEYNVETGACAGDPSRKLRRLETVEREGGVYVVA